MNSVGIISKNTTLESIKDYIENSFGYALIQTGLDNGHFNVYFNDGSDPRAMCIFLGEVSRNDFNIDGICISLGNFGNAKNIIVELLGYFGGYYRENDDAEFIQISIEKFTSEEISEKDAFTNKIIQTLGYDNLGGALELFDEYKSMLNKKPIEMIRKLRQGHYESEDCWYSCPMSSECCNDNREDECDCGADKTNESIEK